MTWAVIYLALGLLMLLAGIGVALWFAYRYRELRDSMPRVEESSEELLREQAIRRNLQRICDRRSAELEKMKRRLRAAEDHAQELENQITQLNVNLFQESGRRILAEKDEGARRMKLDLQDRQLEELRRQLKRQEAEARENEEKLRAQAEALEAELERLRAGRARRSGRRQPAAEPPAGEQITVEEILNRA